MLKKWFSHCLSLTIVCSFLVGCGENNYSLFESSTTINELSCDCSLSFTSSEPTSNFVDNQLSYYENHLSDKTYTLRKIREQNNIDYSFAFITDLHWESNEGFVVPASMQDTCIDKSVSVTPLITQEWVGNASVKYLYGLSSLLNPYLRSSVAAPVGFQEMNGFSFAELNNTLMELHETQKYVLQ